MTVIFLLIPLSVVIATGFLFAFIWAVRSGQYEDTCTPSMRMLLHDLPSDPRGSGAGSLGKLHPTPTPLPSAVETRPFPLTPKKSNP
jgi:cbb3-type cytochrome oxidase maturation protein